VLQTELAAGAAADGPDDRGQQDRAGPGGANPLDPNGRSGLVSVL